ncbi:MAG: T9SS type A sorting domain-containing protein [Bacteroidetes bacterium]|nr:T9SS type A sorting domain-containing protein [Bacteroidota bacterium]
MKKALETSGIFHEAGFHRMYGIPNPGRGVYTIQYLSETSGIAHLTAHNIHGEVLLQQKLQSEAGVNRPQIDLSTQPAGTYVVKLQAGTKQALIRIIKQ